MNKSNKNSYICVGKLERNNNHSVVFIMFSVFYAYASLFQHFEMSCVCLTYFLKTVTTEATQCPSECNEQKGRMQKGLGVENSQDQWQLGGKKRSQKMATNDDFLIR